MKISVLKLVAACFIVAALIGVCQWAAAAEPDMNSLSPPPEAAYGVSKCGEIVVLWIIKVDPDGHLRAYRTDVFHHPDDESEYTAFLQWVGRTPKDRLDMFELPCPKAAK